MAYASYSQGFRAGFPQDPTLRTLGFADVEPDRLRNYEIGSKGALMDGLVAYDASVYYMNWVGIQSQLTVLPPEDFIAVVNGQSASGIGTDLALTVEPLKDLILRGTFSWNNLEYDHDVISGGLVLYGKGDRLAASPAKTMGLAGEYSFPLAAQGFKGRVAASANYTSSQSYRNLEGSSILIQAGDPITIVRASFALESPTNWTATVYADNINNEKGSPVEAFVGTVNWNTRVRPRTVGLQIDYRFR